MLNISISSMNQNQTIIIEQLLETELESRLRELEYKKRKIREYWFHDLRVYGIPLILFALVLSMISSPNLSGKIFTFIPLSMLLLWTLSIKIVIKMQQPAIKHFIEEYINYFRQEILQPVFQKFYSELYYFSDTNIPEQDLKLSKIYDYENLSSPSQYSCHGCLSGQLQSFSFRIGVIRSELFSGILIILECHYLMGLIQILPNLYTWRKSNSEADRQKPKFIKPKSVKVSINDDDFTRQFVVYSLDPNNIDDILDTQLKEVLLYIKKTFHQYVAFSIVENNIYIGIPNDNSSLFSFPSTASFSPISKSTLKCLQTNINEFQLIHKIIIDLNNALSS